MHESTESGLEEHYNAIYEKAVEALKSKDYDVIDKAIEEFKKSPEPATALSLMAEAVDGTAESGDLEKTAQYLERLLAAGEDVRYVESLAYKIARTLYEQGDIESGDKIANFVVQSKGRKHILDSHRRKATV